MSGRPRRYLGMSRDNALIVLSYIFHGAATGLYQHILPLYVELLGARPDQVGLAVALQAGSGFVAILVAGLLVGRFSYRRQLLAAWALAAVAVALFVAAPAWQVVALGMALSSMVNFVIPAQSSYVTAAAEGQPVQVVFSNLFAASAAGAVVTPLLGGAIIASHGFRWVFVVALAFKLVALAFMWPISERGPSPAERAAAGPGAPLGGAFFAPLRSSRFRVVLLALAALYVGTSTGTALFPNYLHDRVGLDPAAVGMLGSVAAAVSIAGTTTLGRLAVRLGSLRCLAIAQAIAVAGFGLALAAPGLGRWAAPVGALGFGARGAQQVQASLSRGVVPFIVPGAAGPGYALQSALLMLANAVGALVAGGLYLRDPALPLATAASVGLLVIVVLAIMPDTTRAPLPAPSLPPTSPRPGRGGAGRGLGEG